MLTYQTGPPSLETTKIAPLRLFPILEKYFPANRFNGFTTFLPNYFCIAAKTIFVKTMAEPLIFIERLIWIGRRLFETVCWSMWRKVCVGVCGTHACP